MITAIDTNILIDVLGKPNPLSPFAAEALDHALAKGALVICPVVASEISISFHDANHMKSMMEEMRIGLSSFDWEALHLAGKIFVSYRHMSSKPKDRMLSDFLVAAHAFCQADALLTRDRGFYRFYFPKLKIIEVTGKPSSSR